MTQKNELSRSPETDPLTVAYIANIRFPTEKAHGYQIARVLSALTEIGVTSKLIVPTRKNHITAPWHEYYGVEPTFTVRTVWCPDLFSGNPLWDRIAFLTQTVMFGIRLCFLAISKSTVIMTRDKGIAWLYGVLGYRVVYSAHSVTGNKFLYRMLLKRVAAVVANSEGTKAAVEALLTTRVVVAHNGADQNPYISTERSVLRKELELPRNKHIVLYSGHLYSWKGIDTVLDAAKHLRTNKDVEVVVIGGLPADVFRYREYALREHIPNIVFLGHQDKSLVPKFLAAADVLLLPNSAQTEESITQTSPLKLFEYLASGRTIIASDLPSIRSVVSDREVFFVTPDDGSALAFAIEYALEREDEARSRREHSLTLSKTYTWSAHTEILKSVLVARLTKTQ